MEIWCWQIPFWTIVFINRPAVQLRDFYITYGIKREIFLSVSFYFIVIWSKLKTPFMIYNISDMKIPVSEVKAMCIKHWTFGNLFAWSFTNLFPVHDDNIRCSLLIYFCPFLCERLFKENLLQNWMQVILSLRMLQEKLCGPQGKNQVIC